VCPVLKQLPPRVSLRVLLRRWQHSQFSALNTQLFVSCVCQINFSESIKQFSCNNPSFKIKVCQQNVLKVLNVKVLLFQ